MSLKICEILRSRNNVVQMQPGRLVANLTSPCEKMMLLATYCKLDFEQSESVSLNLMKKSVSNLILILIPGLRQRLRGNKFPLFVEERLNPVMSTPCKSMS